MAKKYQRILNMQNGITSTKLFNSPYWTDVVDMVKNAANPYSVYRYLNEDKKFKVSYPTVLTACQYIRLNGDKALALFKESEKAVLKENEEIKKIAPSLTNMFTRRTNLITEILKRKMELLNLQKEGDRVLDLIKMLDIYNNEMIKNLKPNITNQELIDFSKKYTKIIDYIKGNFTSYKIDTNVEGLIRNYIKDLHDIYKYVEEFTGKYDIMNVIDNLSLDITRSAVETFGKFIRQETPEVRSEILNKFKQSIKSIVNDIKLNKLDIKEDEVVYNE